MTQSLNFNFQETLELLRNIKISLLKSNFWSKFFSYHLEQNLRAPLRKKNIYIFLITLPTTVYCPKLPFYFPLIKKINLPNTPALGSEDSVDAITVVKKKLVNSPKVAIVNLRGKSFRLFR